MYDCEKKGKGKPVKGKGNRKTNCKENYKIGNIESRKEEKVKSLEE